MRRETWRMGVSQLIKKKREKQLSSSTQSMTCGKLKREESRFKIEKILFLPVLTHRQSMKLKTRNFSKLQESFHSTSSSLASHIVHQSRAHAWHGTATKSKPLMASRIRTSSPARIQWCRIPSMEVSVSFYELAPPIRSSLVRMHSRFSHKANSTRSRMLMDGWECSRRRRKFPYQCKWQDYEWAYPVSMWE